MKARNEELYGLQQGYAIDSLRVAWGSPVGFVRFAKVFFHPQKHLLTILLLKKAANCARKNYKKNSN
jgi:hypothetical protein